MADKSKEKRNGPPNTFSEGTTPLQMACASNQPQIVKMLMDHPKIDLNLVNSDEDSALHFTARSGHLPILEQLLQAGSKLLLNERNTFGYTPLHVAVLNNHAAMVNKLLEQQDLDTSIVDKDNKTALQYAEEENLTAIVAAIKKYDDEVVSALTKAARS